MKNKRKYKSKFLRIVVTIVGIFLIIGFVVVYGYGMLGGNVVANKRPTKDAEPYKPSFSESFKNMMMPALKEHTNFIAVGVDKDATRTDTIMVGSFNATTARISAISVPRDTKTKMSDNRINYLRQNGEGNYISSDGVMRINEVHHHSGKYGMEMLMAQVEELLGIDIDFYVKIDVEAFRFLVDEIGGVEFDVPQRMVYDDPAQDFHINLYPGYQLLNGEQAEGLVRYRKGNKDDPNATPSYPRADIDRIAVQQQFMKAVAEKLISQGNIVNSITALAQTAIKHVDTNFSPAEIPKYAKYATRIDMDSIDMYVLPGKDANINGKSYFIIDEEGTELLVEEVFYKSGLKEKTGSTSAADKVNPSDLRIQVLNGGDTIGLASETRDMLVDKGYNVVDVGDYTGERKNYTRIKVKNRELGEHLKQYFPGSEIELDNNLSGDYNVVVILTTDKV